jgi:uncharacterized protein YggE
MRLSPAGPLVRALLATLLAACAAPMAAAQAVLPPGPARAAPEPAITVRGTCTEKLVPDRARLAAWVQRDAPTATAAARAAAEAYNRFEHDLRGLGLPGFVLDSNGVQTQRLTDSSSGRPRAAGFESTAGATIESSSLEGLAEAVRVAGQDGIDNVGAIQSFVSDAARDRAAADCLPRATADARAKAEALLRGLGAGLGGPVRVANLVISGGEGETAQPMGRMAPMLAAMPAPAVAAAPQPVSVGVDVTFRILPPPR